MAKRRHHRRHHRRFGDAMISMPSFGDAKEYNPLGKTVHSTDVAVGAGIGLAGGGLIMYGQKQFWPTAPAFVTQYAGPISAIAAGIAAHAVYRKKSPGKAEGYLVGAMIVGVVPALYALVKGAMPASVSQYFGDPMIAMPRFGSFIVNRPRSVLGGMIVNRPSPGMVAPAAVRALRGGR